MAHKTDLCKDHEMATAIAAPRLIPLEATVLFPDILSPVFVLVSRLRNIPQLHWKQSPGGRTGIRTTCITYRRVI